MRRDGAGTHLAGRLVVIKAVLTFLDSRSLWFPLHVGFDPHWSVYLTLDGEITRLRELSGLGSISRRLRAFVSWVDRRHSIEGMLTAALFPVLPRLAANSLTCSIVLRDEIVN